jgi:uncharacterized protein YkwD
MKRSLLELSAAVALLVLTCSGCGYLTDPTPAQADANTPAIDTVVQGAVDISTVEPAGAPVGPSCVEIAEPSTTTQKAMYDALNAYRQQNGLAPLIYSKRLEAAGQAQVIDLWTRNYFAHVNPDGQDPGQRAVAVGFCHKYVGENLAAGQKGVDSVMTAWKNSPGHNENMLESQYVYVGMAFSVDANGRMYWAQEFAYDLP